MIAWTRDEAAASRVLQFTPPLTRTSNIDGTSQPGRICDQATHFATAKRPRRSRHRKPHGGLRIGKYEMVAWTRDEAAAKPPRRERRILTERRNLVAFATGVQI